MFVLDKLGHVLVENGLVERVVFECTFHEEGTAHAEKGRYPLNVHHIFTRTDVRYFNLVEQRNDRQNEKVNVRTMVGTKDNWAFSSGLKHLDFFDLLLVDHYFVVDSVKNFNH